MATRKSEASGARSQPGHRRTAVYVGLAILLLLLIEATSGWLLWVSTHRQATLAQAFLGALPAERLNGPWTRWLLDVTTVTWLHVWFGYWLLGLTGVKLWAVWWLLRRWFPRRYGRQRLLFEKVMAWSLPLIYGVVLATGIVLDQRFVTARWHDTVRDVHLWSSELAAPVSRPAGTTPYVTCTSGRASLPHQ
jgi:hypothetical protein